VLTEPTLGGTPPTAPLSVGDILAYACDPQTTRSRRAGSHQLTEWKRARREAEALLLHHLPFERLTGDHIGALGRSALLRTSLGCELPRWSELLASVLDAGQLADATHLKDRVDRAAAAWLSARATTNSAGELSTTGSWGKRAAQLLRAMFRHAVSRGGARFKPVAGFEIPMDFTVELEVTADDHEITVEDPNQPRQDATAARNLMRHLGDPRYYMAAVLATVLNAKGAMRACRSQVRVDANGVAIRHNNGSAERPQWTWYELDASAAAFMRWLLAGPYAPLESERRAGGPDYRLVADVRWDGVRAQRIRALSDMPDPEADALLDPRGWLLFVLGVEGRAGQVVRASGAT
jgi:hypothetical protein